jgi:hypothetical protein
MKDQITQDEMFAPIVTAIQDVSEAFQKLQSTKVHERVIYLLIRDMTGLGLGEIETVIKAAGNLSKKFLK